MDEKPTESLPASYNNNIVVAKKKKWKENSGCSIYGALCNGDDEFIKR